MITQILNVKYLPRQKTFFISLSFLSICIISQPAMAVERVKFVKELTSELKAPVDVANNTNGDIYVLDRKAAKVFVFNSDGQSKFTFGDKGTELGNFLNPQNITIAPNGNVIIADTGNKRLQVFDSQGYFQYQLGQEGKLPGQFKMPTNVAVDPSGNIFTIDSIHQTVTKFSPKGVFLHTQKLEHKPSDIVFDNQQIAYILMSEAGKIMKFTDANFTKGTEVLFQPDLIPYISDSVSLSVDASGDIYLIENKLYSIQKLDQNTKRSVLSFGSKGIGRGQFNNPSGIMVDQSGRIYVADTNNHRVQILDVIGGIKNTLVSTQPANQIIDFHSSIPAEQKIVDLSIIPEKGLYALSDYQGHILRKQNKSQTLEKLSKQQDKLDYPQAMYVNEAGELLIADTGNNRLQFINADGTFQYRFGEKGSKSSQFNSAQGVAISRKGYIYVADTKNQRIQIFSNDGIYLDEFGLKPSKDDKNSASVSFMPTTLLFNSKDYLYVLDNQNKRIQIFTEEGKLIDSINQSASDRAVLRNPVDIAIDEHDYLYVADREDHSIKIFNPEGEYYFSFGSSGKGPSYFPQLSAVDALDGKIYVADYKVDQVKVFSFNPWGSSSIVKKKQLKTKEAIAANSVKSEKKEGVVKKLAKTISPISILKKVHKIFDKVKCTYKAKIVKERLIVTATTSPINEKDLLKEGEGYSIAREKLVTLTTDLIISKMKLSKEYVNNTLNIESEKLSDKGVMELVVSIPKDHI